MVRKAGAERRNRHLDCGGALMRGLTDAEKAILSGCTGPHHRPCPTRSFSEDRLLCLFRSMESAAAQATDDPDTWVELESSVAELLEHIVDAITHNHEASFAGFSERERDIACGECDASNLGELRHLLDLLAKRGLFRNECALAAIETGLRQERKRKRTKQTDAQRRSAVFAMDAEREKGASRQDALEAVNKTEDGVKQYVTQARSWLVTQGFVPPDFEIVSRPKRRRRRRR